MSKTEIASQDLQIFFEQLSSLVKEQPVPAAFVESVTQLYQQLDLTLPALQPPVNFPKFGRVKAIYKAQNFRVNKLLLHKNAKLPVHDHPEMTGVILVLTGKVKLITYERLDGVPLRLKQVLQTELRPGDITYLTPTENNIHTFWALEDATLLETFLPFYSGRRWPTYYKIERQEEEKNNLVVVQKAYQPLSWLRPIIKLAMR